MAAGDFAAAEEGLRRSRSRYETYGTPDDAAYLASIDNYAQVLGALRRPLEQEAFLQRVADVADQDEQKDGALAAYHVGELARFYSSFGQLGRATRVIERALELVGSRDNTDAQARFETTLLAGQIANANRDYARAEILLEPLVSELPSTQRDLVGYYQSTPSVLD